MSPAAGAGAAPGVVARRLRIRGRVQGVGFRAWLVQVAARAGLAGWVRNRGDGSVEAWLEGPAAAVAAVAGECRKGPSAAAVTAVEAEDAPPQGLGGFKQGSTLL